MTLCPALRAMMDREVPKPEEQPVMSQTRGLEADGILKAAVLAKIISFSIGYASTTSAKD